MVELNEAFRLRLVKKWFSFYHECDRKERSRWPEWVAQLQDSREWPSPTESVWCLDLDERAIEQDSLRVCSLTLDTPKDGERDDHNEGQENENTCYN